MFKRVLGVLAVAVMAASLTGCSDKPKIPANTVVAGYVNLESGVDNLKDIAEIVIDALPAEMAKEARSNYEALLKDYEDYLEPCDFKWAAATVVMDGLMRDPEVAVAVRCDYTAKTKEGKSLVDVAEMAAFNKQNEHGITIYHILEIGAFVAFVDEEYIILSPDAETTVKMVKLYDGDGDTSDAFDELTDIEGDTVARIQTADMATIAELLAIREDIEKFGKNCDDEELAEYILDIGQTTLDIELSEDVVGATLKVEAGSKYFAKVVEGAFNIVEFANRLGVDVAVAMNPMVKQFGGLFGLSRRELNSLNFDTSAGRMLREGMEVDRSGSTVTLSFELDTEEVVEKVVETIIK